jgi:hypothetical protein
MTQLSVLRNSEGFPANRADRLFRLSPIAGERVEVRGSLAGNHALRFWNHQVRQELDSVLQAIWFTLQKILAPSQNAH